jgi:hypothetical protein
MPRYGVPTVRRFAPSMDCRSSASKLPPVTVPGDRGERHPSTETEKGHGNDARVLSSENDDSSREQAINAIGTIA